MFSPQNKQVKKMFDHINIFLCKEDFYSNYTVFICPCLQSEKRTIVYYYNIPHNLI